MPALPDRADNWAPSVKQWRSLLTGALDLFLHTLRTPLIHDGMRIGNETFHIGSSKNFLERDGFGGWFVGFYKGRSRMRDSLASTALQTQ